MDQNFIQNVKITYRKQQLHRAEMTKHSNSLYDGIKTIQNMIGAVNIDNGLTEEDINDWAQLV